MTKQELAERIIRRITGGPISRAQSGKYMPELFYTDIAHKYATLCKTAYNQNWQMGEHTVGDEWLTAYPDVAVLYDEQRQRYYSTIPGRYVGLPNGMGLYHISFMNGENKQFIPMQAGMQWSLNGLAAQTIDGQTGYWIEGTKVYYNDNFPIATEPVVLMKMVAAIEGLGPREEIMIPMDMEDMLVDAVVALYVPPVPEDKTNNNNTAN